MQQRHLGASDLAVSDIGFGCMGLTEPGQAKQVIGAALDAGVTFFDTAEVYGSQQNEILPVLIELGIGLVPFSPLGKGFLTGTINTSADVAGRTTSIFPRFNDDTLSQHRALVDTVTEVAARHDCTPGQVALAWIIATLPYASPIPGTSKASRATENSEAAGVRLSDDDIAELNETSARFQVDPTRYPEGMQAWINR